MRIVTRPDFDGIICAVLLKEKHKITEPILWAEPSDIQNNSVNIRSGDIIANLPYHENCSLWFDHHYSNPRNFSFEGAFKLDPSAARVIFEYYGKDFRQGRAEIVKETDRIDSADLNQEEVLNPEQNQYLLISMSIESQKFEDEPYWNHLVNLFETSHIRSIMEDPQVKKRCRDTIHRNETYKNYLHNHTRLVENITVTDFRGFDEPPTGNRFLVYSLFPESIANMKIRYLGSEKKMVTINVGHSIFNRNCNVNVGIMLSQFNGGGHRGAGACNVKSEEASEVIEKIKNILIENKNDE